MTHCRRAGSNGKTLTTHPLLRKRMENEMNREILFRGKRIDNGEWMEGYVGKYFDGFQNVTCIAWPTRETITGSLCYVVDPTTVGQYTGLTDKNGRRIFEGDILKWDSDEYGSEYNEICSWDYELLDMRKNDWKEWCEVIGNIHDNSELAEG